MQKLKTEEQTRHVDNEEIPETKTWKNSENIYPQGQNPAWSV